MFNSISYYYCIFPLSYLLIIFYHFYINKMKIFFLFLINVLFILSKKIKTKYQRVIISIREINMTNSTNKGSVWYLPNIANPSKKIGYYNSTCSQNAPIVERGFLVSQIKKLNPIRMLVTHINLRC